MADGRRYRRQAANKGYDRSKVKASTLAVIDEELEAVAWSGAEVLPPERRLATAPAPPKLRTEADDGLVTLMAEPERASPTATRPPAAPVPRSAASEEERPGLLGRALACLRNLFGT